MKKVLRKLLRESRNLEELRSCVKDHKVLRKFFISKDLNRNILLLFNLQKSGQFHVQDVWGWRSMIPF